jgi:hypothetical protein
LNPAFFGTGCRRCPTFTAAGGGFQSLDYLSIPLPMQTLSAP